VARCYLRKATLNTTGDERFSPEPMRTAEARLKAILADKSLASMHPAAQSLLDYVQARLHPEQRTHAIAKQLESGAGGEFKEQLFDYTYLLDHILAAQPDTPEYKALVKAYSGPAAAEQVQDAAVVDTWRDAAKKAGSFDDLTDWVLTFQMDGALSVSYRLQRWQATKSLPWLISALAVMRVGDPHVDEVARAAEAIGPESPAYDTALYNRVRLLLAENKNGQARKLLDTNMGRIEKEPPSDQNAFLAQRFSVAVNFEEFQRFAPRTPVELYDNIGKRSYYCMDGSCSIGNGPSIPPPPRLQLDSVNIFNQRLPLTMLVQAANGTTLPTELRNELAARTWLRAALLDDTTVAHELEPHVVAAYPEMQNYIEQYDKADSPAARKFAVVFMVMHFSGTQPFVNAGPMGSVITPGINSYASWWCYDVGEAQEHRPDQRALWSAAGSGAPPSMTVGDVGGTAASPAWVTPAELARAEKEHAKIAAIGAAPLYFAPVVLDWAKAYPDDPRVPEALHYFVRASRFGCVDKSIGPYSRRAFDLLHKKYPQSEWAKQTPYWFG
jgi:hypothetical protein